MSLVAINATSTTYAGLPALRAAVEELPTHGRITIMIHGYKFAPEQKGKCPHTHILSFSPPDHEKRAISWPKHLQVGPHNLGIAFGWDSCGSLWGAWNAAERAGQSLARLLNELSRMGRTADIIAHSFGARVALTALRYTSPGAVRRKILIAPAEFRDTAHSAMMSPAGQAASVLSITSGENMLYDTGLKWLLALHKLKKKPLGAGLGHPLPNWTELRIDNLETLDTLAELGYRIALPARRVCHWSGYLRPGLFPLYRDVLSGDLPTSRLAQAVPQHLEKSRLNEWCHSIAPLRFFRKPSF